MPNSNLLEQVGYIQEFITPEKEAEVIEYLGSLPVVPYGESDLTSEFAFTHPVYDGYEITRAEAGAGTPIWVDGEAGEGVEIPVVLKDLADEISLVEEDLPEFTSVYADRYPIGSVFVPHTDRSCYGPVIAGLSLGAEATLRFTRSDGLGQTIDLTVERRSLYVMRGPLRYDPWEHSVVDVKGLRYSTTFRTAAQD